MAWEQEHDGEVFDPESFRSQILPGLRNLRVTDLARLTSLSVPYCSLIKKGAPVPDAMHWHTAAALMISNGEALRGGQEILGHASIAMMADIYAHVVTQRKARGC